MLLLFSPICSTILHSCSSVFHCPSILLNSSCHHEFTMFQYVSLKFPPAMVFTMSHHCFLNLPAFLSAMFGPEFTARRLHKVRPLRSCCATCSRSRPPPAPARHCGAMDGWWRGNGIEGRGILPSGYLSHSIAILVGDFGRIL